MFDEQPDGDPHGECAAEIKRLEIALRIKTEEHDCCAGDVIDLRNFIRKYAKDLTQIVRMPNAEYIADAHNEAVRQLRAEAGLK